MAFVHFILFQNYHVIINFNFVFILVENLPRDTKNFEIPNYFTRSYCILSWNVVPETDKHLFIFYAPCTSKMLSALVKQKNLVCNIYQISIIRMTLTNMY
jgi:hypothetical protein